MGMEGRVVNEWGGEGMAWEWTEWTEVDLVDSVEGAEAVRG